MRKKYYENKMFMKDESYVTYKHARCINSRTDEFKVFSGPFFKAVESVVYAHSAFIKHIPVLDRPAYIKEMLYKVGANYIATDYEAFESLFTKELLEACEFILYDYMSSELPGGREFMAILRGALTGTNKCVNKFFTVFVPATRMSGEMCTSLGNGFTNLMVMLFLCSKLGSTCVGVVEGDDGLFRIEGPLPNKSMFRALGLRIKLDVYSDLFMASFCGIIFDGDALVNICDPFRALVKFGWGGSQYARASFSTKMKLLRCKALSYAYQYPGCPIISTLAHRALYWTRSYDVRSFLDKNRTYSTYEKSMIREAMKSKIPNKPICSSSRFVMEEKFRVPYELQVYIEQKIEVANLGELDFEFLDIFLPKTWFDYHDRYVRRGPVEAFTTVSL